MIFEKHLKIYVLEWAECIRIGRSQLRAFVNMLMHILVPQDMCNVSTLRATVASFEALLST
jgi:hypothetical protein